MTDCATPHGCTAAKGRKEPRHTYCIDTVALACRALVTSRCRRAHCDGVAKASMSGGFAVTSHIYMETAIATAAAITAAQSPLWYIARCPDAARCRRKLCCHLAAPPQGVVQPRSVCLVLPNGSDMATVLQRPNTLSYTKPYERCLLPERLSRPSDLPLRISKASFS